MDGYDKLNFIDKLRFKWRVWQQEKAEDKRQAIEHDDRIAVDTQSIIDELLAERYNKKNKVKALPSVESKTVENHNSMKQYILPKDSVKNLAEILDRKELDYILGKETSNEIDAYENIIDLKTFLSYPHDSVPDAKDKITEKLSHIQQTFGDDVFSKGMEIYKLDKSLSTMYKTISVHDRINFQKEIVDSPELAEQLSDLRYNPEKAKQLSGKSVILLSIYSNMIKESKSNEYNNQHESSQEVR